MRGQLAGGELGGEEETFVELQYVSEVGVRHPSGRLSPGLQLPWGWPAEGIGAFQAEFCPSADGRGWKPTQQALGWQLQREQVLLCGGTAVLSHSSYHPSFPLLGEAQNHRMVGVGRDLCGSSSPTLLPKQGHLQQAAQDLVQAGLEYLQRRRLHSLPGQPGPGLCHPQREEILPPSLFLQNGALSLQSYKVKLKSWLQMSIANTISSL